jgi:signal transduction histidine kinase
MLSGFLFFTILIVVVGGVSIYLFNEVNHMANTHRLINQLQVYTLNLIKNDNDFFDTEVINENYFETHTSKYLNTRDSLLYLMEEGLQLTEKASQQKEYAFLLHLVVIDSLISEYNQKFNRLELLVFQRGFKDAGLEGVMRLHAHALELPEIEISIADILALRRHEKDFLLRHDVEYIQKFNDVSDQLLAQLQQQPIKYKGAIFHLSQYQHYFNQLAEVETEIGLSSNMALRNELNLLATRLSQQYFELTAYAGNLYSNIQNRAQIFYVLITVAALIFSILSGNWISKRLSAPIARLSKMVNLATFDHNRLAEIDLKNAAIEINGITDSFNTLIDKINRQFHEIEDKSAQLIKQNEELNKLNHELDNFVYSAAHDLRAPLTSLLGIVHLMKRDNQQPELNPYLEMMQKSIGRQEDFIHQIVNYAKNKKLEIIPERLDLKKILLDVFQNHEFVPGAAEIEKFIHLREEESFYSDRNRISIIFNNLVSNAIRYADLNKSMRYIQCRILTSKESATIEFIDNGVGIEPDHLDKIFNMFYRANINSKGSGLGLFIFREAIQKLGGFVTVESEIGGGTKFFIQIPNLSKQISPTQLILEMTKS